MLDQDLLRAIQKNDLEKIISLIKENTELLYQPLDKYPSPLHYLVAQKNVDLDLVNLLLSLNADAYYAGDNGISALDSVNFDEKTEACTLFNTHESSRADKHKAVYDALQDELVLIRGKLLDVKDSLSSYAEAFSELLNVLDIPLSSFSEDELLDSYLLIQSISSILPIKDLEDFKSKFKENLMTRSRLIKGSSLDYMLKNNGLNKSLATLVQVFWPETDSLQILMHSSLLLEVDGAIKQWREACTCSEQLEESFFHLKDQTIHYLSTVAATAAARLGQGDYEAQDVWIKTDTRLGEGALPFAYIRAYQDITPSFKTLFEYYEHVAKEKIKSEVLVKLNKLVSGLLAGSSHVRGTGAAELVSGDKANVAVSEFCEWWNRFEQHNPTVAQSLLAIRGPGLKYQTDLKEILAPLIAPKAKLSRTHVSFCVDMIGRGLEHFLHSRGVQTQLNSILGVELEEQSPQVLNKLAADIDEELTKVSLADINRCQSRLPSPFFCNQSFYRVLLIFRALDFPLTYQDFQIIEKLFAKKHSAYEAFIKNMWLLTDSKSIFLLSHLVDNTFFNPQQIHDELVQMAYASPELALLMITKGVMSEDDLIKNASYKVIKYYLSIKSEGALSKEQLDLLTQKAIIREDYGFLSVLVDRGLSELEKFSYLDRRYPEIKPNTCLKTRHPLCPDAGYITGRVISRKGAQIRLSFAGVHRYWLEDHVYSTELTSPEHDLEFDLNDDRVSKKLRDIDNCKQAPNKKYGTIFELAIYTGNIQLINTLIVRKTSGFPLSYLVDSHRNLACSESVLIEVIRNLELIYENQKIDRQVIRDLIDIVIKCRRFDLLLYFLKIEEYRPLVLKSRINSLSFVDYMFSTKREDFFSVFFSSPELMKTYIYNHDAWQLREMPYRLIKQYGMTCRHEKLSLSKICVSEIELKKIAENEAFTEEDIEIFKRLLSTKSITIDMLRKLCVNRSTLEFLLLLYCSSYPKDRELRHLFEELTTDLLKAICICFSGGEKIDSEDQANELWTDSQIVDDFVLQVTKSSDPSSNSSHYDPLVSSYLFLLSKLAPDGSKELINKKCLSSPGDISLCIIDFLTDSIKYTRKQIDDIVSVCDYRLQEEELIRLAKASCINLNVDFLAVFLQRRSTQKTSQEAQLRLSDDCLRALADLSFKKNSTSLLSSVLELGFDVTKPNGTESSFLEMLYANHKKELFQQCCMLMTPEKAQCSFRQLIESNRPLQPTFLRSLVKKGANIWPFMTELNHEHTCPIILDFDTDLTGLKFNIGLAILLDLDVDKREKFLLEFKRIYNALYENKNFKFFRARNRWEYRELTVQSLFYHIEQKPWSISAKALDILKAHLNDFETISRVEYLDIHPENQKKQLALFKDIHKQAKHLSFFMSSTHISTKASWEDVKAHAASKPHSRTSVILRALSA